MQNDEPVKENEEKKKKSQTILTLKTCDPCN
jgi:hypothetical protein